MPIGDWAAATTTGKCGCVGAEQDDPADLAAADPAEQVGAGGRPVHPDDQLLADELGERRAGRRCRSGGRRHDRQDHRRRKGEQGQTAAEG